MTSLRDDLAYVLEHYLRARTTERIGRGSEVWRRLTHVPQTLATTAPVRARPHLFVKASAGQGSWSHIPWVALLDGSLTTTTRDGVYVIYLFRADMSGVYLTLNQGVTEPLKRLGTEAGLLAIRTRAGELRQRVPDLAQHGFEFDAAIDLRSEQASAKSYTASTIVHRLYALEQLPDDERFVADLDVALAAYARVCAEP